MANMGSPARQGRLTTSDPAARQYLDTYEIDKRSIFVGNLPADITEDELQEIFQPFGEVVQVTLHKNDSTVDSTSSANSSWSLTDCVSSQPKALLRLR